MKKSIAGLAPVAVVLFVLTTLTADACGQPTFRQIALTGDAAPGTGGAVFTDFATPRINSVGEVIFSATLGGSATDDDNSGFFAETLGPGLGVDLLLREGDVAPGAGGAVFSDLGFVTVRRNAAGGLAFRGPLRDPTGMNPDASAAFGPTATADTTLLFRGGDPVPGSAGDLFGSFFGLRINEAGDLAFSVELLDGAGARTGRAIFGPTAGNGSPPGLIVRTGDAVTGAPGLVYSSLSPPEIDATGGLVFNANGSVDDGGPLVGMVDLLVRSSPTGVQSLLFREGDAAPGVPGFVFASSFSEVSVNPAGDVSFNVELEPVGGGPDREALFGPGGGAGSPIGLIALEGQVVPGTGGATIDDEPGEEIALNAAGSTLFEIEELNDGTGDPPVTSLDDQALLAAVDGRVRLALRENDTVQVELPDGSTEMRVVDSFGFGASSLSDTGLVAVRLNFNGGSEGVFVFDLASVPPAPDQPLFGDFNNDDTVDASDFTVLRDLVGDGVNLPNDLTPGDASAVDLVAFRRSFGAGGAGVADAAGVPEPSAFVSLLGAVGVLGRRWRRR